MNERPVTLVDIGDGAAVEQFQLELERVIRNIADPNTDPTAARAINLKVVIKPDENRQVGDVFISCTSKLPSGKPFKTRMYVVRRGGKETAIEQPPPKQMGIPGAVVDGPGRRSE